LIPGIKVAIKSVKQKVLKRNSQQLKGAESKKRSGNFVGYIAM
jgi:hypothetical protein